MSDVCNKNKTESKIFIQNPKNIFVNYDKWGKYLLVIVTITFSVRLTKNIYNRMTIWLKEDKDLDVINAKCFITETTDMIVKKLGVVIEKQVRVFCIKENTKKLKAIRKINYCATWCILVLLYPPKAIISSNSSYVH